MATRDKWMKTEQPEHSFKLSDMLLIFVSGIIIGTVLMAFVMT